MQIHPEWKQVLAQVQEVFPGAVIAGGALRDTHAGKPVKDVDVFIPVAEYDMETVDRIQKFAAAMNATPHKLSAPAGGYDVKHIPDDADRDLWAIYTYHGTEYEYDFIFCTEEACDTTTFDINICQVMYDGDDVYGTMAFWQGHDEKVIKLMNVNRTDRNAKRIARIAEKYPEYTIGE